MSFFDKIKSAVMGNPVTREFELGRHVASAGPGLLWRVHSGFKKTSRQEVSIFVFDKKASEFEKLPKRKKEAIYEMLKKGPTQLIKLRHPRLLTIEHQVEESGDTLAFVSEPIFASLANLLGHYDNMPSPLPLVIKEHQLHPIEIQHGLVQVAEGLNFLHGDAKLMHGNLTPQNVVINSKGNWKVVGFNFCCYSHYQSEAQTSFAFRDWDTRKPLHTNPSLDYLAPEYILTKSCGTGSDVFSYGMLAYSLYNGGKPLFESHNNMLSFKQNVEQVSRISESALGGVPDELKPLVRSMLAVEPSVRPDALEITKHPFFEELAVSILKYLDCLFEKKDMEKSQFFKKNLARVITKLPKRIVHQRILPPLAEEFRNPKMIPFVLPLVLLIAEDCTLNEYSDLILPILAPAMAVHEPVQIPLIFLQKMDLLLKMTPQDKVQQHVLPMIIKSLGADNNQVQELCVSILPTFASMVDYSSMKHSIVPRITALCLETRGASLCIKCLVCLGQLLDILDKHIVLEHILPVLHQIPSRHPGILMAMLGIFHQTLTKPKLGLEKKVLAETIIPYLLPLSIEPSLNLKQFNQFMKVIREMLMKVETEQQSHLDQLSKMEEQTKSTVQFAREVTETKAMDDAIDRLEGMFAGADTREEAVAPRRGDTSAKSGSFTSPTSGSSENSNFLTGVKLSDLSSTFASNSSYPKTSTQPLSATPIKPSLATSTDKPSPSLMNRAQTLQPAKSGYQPPPMLQPQKAENASTGDDLLSGLVGTSNLTGPGGNTISNTGSGGWSSSIFTPGVSETSKSASNWSSNMLTPNASSNSMHHGGGRQEASSIFSGITASPSSHQPTHQNPAGGGGGGLFGGMNVTQSSGQMSNQQPGPGYMPTGPGGLGQPLVPIQSGSAGESSAKKIPSAGWSTGIQGSGGRSGMGMGQNWNANAVNLQGSSGTHHQTQNAGWSSSYSGMGSGNVNGSVSGSAWSQGMQGGMGQQYGQTNSSMGMNQQGMSTNQQTQFGSNNAGVGVNQQTPSGYSVGVRPNIQQQTQSSYSMGMNQQSNFGTGMNWSNIQSQQPVDVIMGGAQPLLSAPGRGGAMSAGHTQQPSQGGVNSNKPAPGANPFADLNFLS